MVPLRGLAIMSLALARMAAAQEPNAPPPMIATAPATATEEKYVPFDPPIDTPLRYRITRSSTGELPVRPSVIEQALSFQPLDVGGFELTVSTLSVTQGDTTYTPAGPLAGLRTVADVVALLAPVTFEVSNAGRPMRVRNADDHRANVLLARELSIGAEPSEELRQMVRRTIALNPDALPTATAEALARMYPVWGTVLGYGQLRFVPGQRRTWTDRLRYLDGEAVVTMQNSTTVTPQPDGTYRVRYIREEKPEGFVAAIDKRLASGDPALVRAAREVQAIVPLAQEVEQTVTTVLTLDSRGMIVRGEHIVEGRERNGRQSTFTTAIDRVE